ncbi:hypothetical protein QR680_007347 [Steinernema hermaphroditum]|uniref:Uncharacterized protein n=1 Tax=Steinernema hermaphroditum TaxID=289476 RepID=A0AA39M612_9BILA|nr:hypothetical protein QR680_007347 [Steinernema hermaphroditum]
MDRVSLDFIERVVAAQDSADLSALRAVQGRFGVFAEEHESRRFDFYIHFDPYAPKCFVLAEPEPPEGECHLAHAEANAKYLQNLRINMAMVERRGQREIPLDDSIFDRLKKLSMAAVQTTLEVGNRRERKELDIFSRTASKLAILAGFVDVFTVKVTEKTEAFEELAKKVLQSEKLRSITFGSALCDEKFNEALQGLFFQRSSETFIVDSPHSTFVPGIVDKWIHGDEKLGKKFICCVGDPKINFSLGFQRQEQFHWEGYDYPEMVGDLHVPQWIRERIEENIMFEYNPTARFFRLEHPKIPNYFACLTLVVDIDNILTEFDDIEREFQQLQRDEDEYTDFLRERIAAMNDADFASRNHYYYLFFCERK